jgi:hypothetical protein
MMKLVSLLVASSLFFSCATTPEIETYILNATVQQNFIRPSIMKNASLLTEIDFTIRNEKDEITKVVVNFSIRKSKAALEPLEQASFILDNNEIVQFSEITPLFIDRNNSVSRYSSTISPIQFKTLIQQRNPLFRLVLKSKTYDFKPTSQFMTQLRGAETQYIY